MLIFVIQNSLSRQWRLVLLESTEQAKSHAGTGLILTSLKKIVPLHQKNRMFLAAYTSMLALFPVGAAMIHVIQ